MREQSSLTAVGPVNLVHLFPGLHRELMALLQSLDPADWMRSTTCALWSVKDIVAHLLDTCLRRLSFGRDGMDATPDHPITTYQDLVGFLNQLNADWIKAMRRLSPPVLIDLVDRAELELHHYLASLDPQEPARFGVAWAGEERSLNWFDVGREYTERWLHQQQIRDALEFVSGQIPNRVTVTTHRFRQVFETQAEFDAFSRRSPRGLGSGTPTSVVQERSKSDIR